MGRKIISYVVLLLVSVGVLYSQVYDNLFLSVAVGFFGGVLYGVFYPRKNWIAWLFFRFYFGWR